MSTFAHFEHLRLKLSVSTLENVTHGRGIWLLKQGIAKSSVYLPARSLSHDGVFVNLVSNF